MKTEQMEFSVHWMQHEYSNKPTPNFFPADNKDMAAYGYHYAGNVTIDVPQADHSELVKAAVTKLRADQAKHTAAITELDRRIQELLCIEYKPEAETA